VALRWGANRDEHHTVLLEVQAQGRPGLMAELVSRVATVGADVSSAKSERIKDEAVRIRLGVDCNTAEQLTAVLDRLSSHPDVMSAERYQE
jgi:(p)ppGpp synthase/HD superfamily hydrolase